MDRIMKHNRIITSILAVLLAFSSVILSVSDTYAVVSDEVQWVNSGYNNMNVYANGTVSCTSNCDFVINNNADVSVGIQTIQFGIQSGQYYQNQIIQFNLSFWKVSNSTSIHADFNSLQVVDNANLKFYDLTFDNLDTNSFVAHIYIKVVNDVYISNRVQVQGVGSLFMFLLQPTERVSVNSWTLWQVIDTTVDTSGIIGAIQAQPNYTQNLNSIRNDIQNVQNSVEDLNQTQQDIYDDEKETIQDSVDQAEEDAAGLTPSFSLPNPFRNLFGGFSDSCSVDISTLKSLIGNPRLTKNGGTTINSWWCKDANTRSIRSVLTSVFSIISVLIVFVMVWKWLTKPSGESS